MVSKWENVMSSPIGEDKRKGRRGKIIVQK